MPLGLLHVSTGYTRGLKLSVILLHTLYAWYGTYGGVSMPRRLYVSKRQHRLRGYGVGRRVC